MWFWCIFVNSSCFLGKWSTEMFKSTIFMYDGVPRMRRPQQKLINPLHCLRCSWEGITNGRTTWFGRSSSCYYTRNTTSPYTHTIELEQCWFYHNDHVLTGTRPQIYTIASQTNWTATTSWSSAFTISTTQTWSQINCSATAEALVDFR